MAGTTAGAMAGEDNLREFIENAAVALHRVGPDGIILWANQAELDLLGYAREEYIGQHIARFHADAPVIQDILARLTRGETLYNYPSRLLCKDGSTRHVIISSNALFENGKFIHTRCFTRDITERKQAEENLRDLSRLDSFAAQIGKDLIESGELPEMLNHCTRTMVERLDAAFARIWTLNGPGDVLELQASSGIYTHLNGAHARVPVGSLKIGLIGAERRPHLTNHVIGDSRVPEQEWARREGIVAFAGYPMVVDGRLVGVIAMFSRHVLSDLTLQALERVASQIALGIDRKRAEGALRESEERLRFMAESMPQKIFTATPNGDVDYFNRQWTEFTGLTFEQIKNWGWTQFVHPDDVEENVHLWQHSIATGEPFKFIHRFRRFDGAYRWHLSRAHAMRDAGGKISMWIGSNTEIHEQKEIEENLLRANADLEQFAYSASHDLQEPIRNISVYGEVLSQRYGDALDAKGKQYLGFVTAGARRMESLVKDLLAYTQSARTADEAAQVDAATALTQALANLSEAIRESGGVVSHGVLPTLRVHEVQLQQLFQNLIGNAIKYRRDGETPCIHVAAGREGGYWRFAVQDNGVGIPPEYSERIFGIFKRLHTEVKYPGTGIGLAICQKIVERNRGRIWVESDGEGKGSTFYFTLPAEGGR